MGRLDFLYRLELPHRAVAVYLYLYERRTGMENAGPPSPTIARELKLSESTVRRAIQDLKKEDLLVTEQRYRARGGKSSLLFQIRKP